MGGLHTEWEKVIDAIAKLPPTCASLVSPTPAQRVTAESSTAEGSRNTNSIVSNAQRPEESVSFNARLDAVSTDNVQAVGGSSVDNAAMVDAPLASVAASSGCSPTDMTRLQLERLVVEHHTFSKRASGQAAGEPSTRRRIGGTSDGDHSSAAGDHDGDSADSDDDSFSHFVFDQKDHERVRDGKPSHFQSHADDDADASSAGDASASEDVSYDDVEVPDLTEFERLAMQTAYDEQVHELEHEVARLRKERAMDDDMGKMKEALQTAKSERKFAGDNPLGAMRRFHNLLCCEFDGYKRVSAPEALDALANMLSKLSESEHLRYDSILECVIYPKSLDSRVWVEVTWKSDVVACMRKRLHGIFRAYRITEACNGVSKGAKAITQRRLSNERYFERDTETSNTTICNALKRLVETREKARITCTSFLVDQWHLCLDDKLVRIVLKDGTVKVEHRDVCLEDYSTACVCSVTAAYRLWRLGLRTTPALRSKSMNSSCSIGTLGLHVRRRRRLSNLHTRYGLLRSGVQQICAR